MKIKIIDHTTKENGTKDIALPADFNLSRNTLLRYIKVYLFNQHQNTTATKTRAEVSGGGKKPWNQKGTGKARAGSTRSPIWVGGGIAHGPRSRNVSRSISKTMSKIAFTTAISFFAKKDQITGLDFSSVKSPSTKIAQNVTDKISGNKKILVVHNNNQNIYKSFRNIKNTVVKEVNTFNAYDISNVKQILIDADAVNELNDRLK